MRSAPRLGLRSSSGAAPHAEAQRTRPATTLKPALRDTRQYMCTSKYGRGEKTAANYTRWLCLAIHEAHSRFVVALARGNAARRGRCDTLKICRTQLDVGSRQVFRETSRVGGSWNGHNVRALRQEPRKGELRRC